MTRVPGRTARLRPRLRRASPSGRSPEPRRAGPTAGATRPETRAGHRREVTSSVYQRLRDLIVTGRLAPGAPLIETELSARLGVSRTPVRAALQRLQQEGFVSASRAGSMLRAVVAPLTSADMREVFLMTGALEAAAARLSAGLDETGRHALSDLMARLVARLDSAASSQPPDISGALAAHVQFHRAFCASVIGPRLLAELEVLQPQAERYERVYAGAVVHAFDEASREHAAIVDALRAGDSDGAESAVQRHWRASAARYRQVVTILGERGNW